MAKRSSGGGLAVAVVNPDTRRSPDEFDGWMKQLRARASTVRGPLFLVQPEVPLFDVFLDAFEALAPKLRQVHNCTCCRHFLERYGGLVAVADGGELVPVFWNPDATEEDGVYAGVEHALAHAVRSASIRAVLIDPAEEWGQASTEQRKGGQHVATWTHFGFTSTARWQPGRKAANEVAAEKREDRRLIAEALVAYPATLVKQAKALLEADQLYRSEKVLGVAVWFGELHARVAGVSNQRLRDNLVWVAAATAPVGFAHIGNTMIGTLLDDLAQEMPVEDVAKRFAAKMHPLQYQRPTAAPSEGQIAQAEKVIAELNAAGSLRRRFAKLEELQTVWRPRDAAPQAQPSGAGVFDHLRPGRAQGDVTDLGAPPTPITWEKFSRTVLPKAEQIELDLPRRNAPYSALVTAADPDAPPIIQWDVPEKRNPVSWYLYGSRFGASGSNPAEWNLPSSGWHPVTAITLSPSQWNEALKMDHQGKGIHLILKDCRDLRAATAGVGLFPEILKGDLREARHTIEAYSRSAVIAGKDEATACGLRLAGDDWNAVVRVTSDGVKTSYRLDRWD